LARNREEYASREGIQDGDLVMREVLNHKSKLHPKYDGPFVATGSTNKDVYQLSTPNGYILQNLVNFDRLRKLSLPEIEQYTGEFWNASKRLKSRDLRAKETHAQREPAPAPTAQRLQAFPSPNLMRTHTLVPSMTPDPSLRRSVRRRCSPTRYEGYIEWN